MPSGIHRFAGTWELVSFEAISPDGTVKRPWGDDPFGLLIWTETGYMSAQLGPRDPARGAYLAYYGTLEVDDVAEGTLTHHVIGGSQPRLMEDQVREFRFDSPDALVLSPPAAADGTRSVLAWRRLKG